MLRSLALAALVLVAAVPARLAAQEARLAEMGTGNVTGVYFPVGVAICRLVNQDRRQHGLRCAARPSEGSVANVAALRAGAIDLAIVQSDVQHAALEGGGAFADAGAFDGLRAVMALHPEPLTIVARADAGIARLQDLPGKRISAGSPGSGQRALWDVVMARMGWTPESFAAFEELVPSRQAAALCEGRIDAFVFTVGHPALTVQEATTGCDAVLVAADGPEVDDLVAASPFFSAATIPGGLYRGNPDEVASFGVMATLVTRADLPDDTIDLVVRGALDNLGMLRGLDPALATLDPADMVSASLSAPLHPAAERYFREQGWVE